MWVKSAAGPFQVHLICEEISQVPCWRRRDSPHASNRGIGGCDLALHRRATQLSLHVGRAVDPGGTSLKKVSPAKNPHVSKAQPIRSVQISKEQHWSVHDARKGSQRDSRRATQVSTDASIPLSYNPKLDSLMLPSVSRELYSA